MAAKIRIKPNGVEPIDEKTVNEDQNVYQEFGVDVKHDKVDNVLQLVCASLNSKIRKRHELELQFNISPSAQPITSHEFDDFYKKLDDKLVENFCRNFCDFIEMKRECDTNQMRLIVKKSPKLYSIRNYLYIPTASSVYESPFEKAVDILRQNGDPDTLPKPPEEGSYKICEIVKNLRQENVDVQFKTINTEKNIAKNMADHLKYISAFANKDGGCLYFGIEDNDGRVVGVNTEKKNEIDANMTNRIGHMILASDHTQKLERGIHWDIKYFHIEADDNLGELFVAKFNSTRLSCKSDDLLELISGDTKTWWTFKKIKEEAIGFVHMSSVTKCFRYRAINDFESVEEGEEIMSSSKNKNSNAANRDRRIRCRKINGEMIDLPFKMLQEIEGKWYNCNSKTPEKKETFDMSFGKGDVLEFVSEDPNDDSCWKMKKIINNKEFSMPISHLKKLHIGKNRHCNVQQMDTEERNVIVITVAKIPGGVLTACPLSYYADDEGIIRKYKFPQWKADMLKTRPEPCNIEIWDLKQNLVDTENDVTLKEYMTKNKCVTLKGLMGTGKTSLALKYCYNFKEANSFSVVWKLKCSNIDLLKESMYELWQQLVIYGNNCINHCQPTNMEKLENEILKQFQYREKVQRSHVLLFDDVRDSSRTHVNNFSEKCLQLGRIQIIMTTLSTGIVINDDSNILEIKGLSSEEATQLFQRIFTNADEDCKTLAAKLWNNPFAICIAVTYMLRSRLTPSKMIRLIGQRSWSKIEKSNSTRDNFNNPPLTSLVRMIGTLADSYKKDEKTHIFEMLLMLQFLEVEDIPIILFSTMFDTVEVDEFVHEVDTISFGIIKGFDDNRLLTVHEMAVMALNEFTQERKIELLKKLMRSFFLSMDKDNNNEKDRSRHKALLPHARKIIDCVNNLSESDRIAIRGTAFQMHHVFVSDVISYMMSMQLNTDHNCERALKHMFILLKMDDPFDIKVTTDRTEHNSRIQQVANIILTSIENILRQKSNFIAVENTGMDYLLNNYRNIEDRDNLSKVLSKQHLAKESQLVEAEYKVLCQKGFAVPQKDIGALFLYELVILILHSYGERSFQESLGYSSPITSKNYLQVAYILSNTITPGCIDLLERHDETHMRPNIFQYLVDFFLSSWTRISYLWKRNPEHRSFNFKSISTILIERSLLQLKMTDIPDDEGVSTIMKYIDICKKRLNETTHYLEFGVFKVDTKSCQLSKLKWMKHIIGLCNELVKVDAVSSRDRVKEECESLTMKIGIMHDNKYKWELQFSLGKLCFELEEFEIAEDLFKPLLPNFTGIQADATTPNYTDLEQQSSLYYIQCRIEREDVNNKFDTETKEMLKIFLICFQSNNKITNELHRLSLKLEETRRDNFS